MKPINYLRWLAFFKYGNHFGYYNRNDGDPIDELDTYSMVHDIKLKNAFKMIDEADQEFGYNLKHIRNKPTTKWGKFCYWIARQVFKGK